MPKKENGEVTCLNHPQIKLDPQDGTSFIQKLDYFEGEDPRPAASGIQIDVYICDECQYMELYAKIPEQKFMQK